MLEFVLFSHEKSSQHLLWGWDKKQNRYWSIRQVAVVGMGADGPHKMHQSPNCFYFCPCISFPLPWVSKSIWSLCSNSLKDDSKISCHQAMENGPRKNRRRSSARKWATCCSGRKWRHTQAASLSLAPPLPVLRLPGAQQGELAPLLILVPSASTSKALLLLF